MVFGLSLHWVDNEIVSCLLVYLHDYDEDDDSLLIIVFYYYNHSYPSMILESWQEAELIKKLVKVYH